MIDKYYDAEKGIYLKLVDFRALYESTQNPIIVNDQPNTTRAERQRFSEVVRTSYKDDTLSSIPSCDCGETKGRYRVGQICPIPTCGTVVVAATERTIESKVWIRSPVGVAPLINPVVWQMLDDFFTFRGFCIVRHLTNMDQGRIVARHTPIVAQLAELGIERGYNNFVMNFDAIVKKLIAAKLHRPSQEDKEDFIKFLQENRNLLFTRYLPIPSKLAFITEDTAVGVYADPNMVPALNAVETIASIDETSYGTTQRTKESRTAKTIMQLASFYLTYIKISIGQKEGWFRKHVFGTRINFSGRAVISSISRPHHPKDMHIPWTFAVALFEIHIANKLLKRGYSIREIEQLIVDAGHRVDPLIRDIFRELMAESPGGTIPAILQRNPSLARSSAQQLNIALIKENLSDRTISFSTQCLAGPNADFDGDEMNLAVILDHHQFAALSRLGPEYSVFDLQRPKTISKINAIPKPVIATIANWQQQNS